MTKGRTLPERWSTLRLNPFAENILERADAAEAVVVVRVGLERWRLEEQVHEIRGPSSLWGRTPVAPFYTIAP
jgi:hypothetical protein